MDTSKKVFVNNVVYRYKHRSFMNTALELVAAVSQLHREAERNTARCLAMASASQTAVSASTAAALVDAVRTRQQGIREKQLVAKICELAERVVREAQVAEASAAADRATAFFSPE